MTRTIRALGLLSGGLDSMLAAAVLRGQGLDVTGICFVTPFYASDRAQEAAAHLSLPLKIVDFTEKFLPLIYDPPHGFGRGHNPCIDCHILMIREAGAVMAAEGFDFVFSGEVLGQRPMSQNRNSLQLVARDSGLADLLLRPLSAKLLPPTQPELQGWVDRERLLDLSGRGRKRQIALAAEYGITRYPAPAGGCLLTDPRYAVRLTELLGQQSRPSLQDLQLLLWGRHFRLAPGVKAVVGRIQKENEALLAVQTPENFVLKVLKFPGPVVILAGAEVSDDDLQAAAGLTAAYSDAPPGTAAEVSVTHQGGTRQLQLEAPPKSDFLARLI
jgi:tRNA-uridine 2-sulfurtransferase